MSKGLEMQIPILDSLRKENKIRVETLGESGAWFKECFKVSAGRRAVTTLTDVRGEGNKTVWFNSRYYRANLLWEKGTFRFRDIHLFDESYKSAYLEARRREPVPILYVARRGRIHVERGTRSCRASDRPIRQGWR